MEEINTKIWLKISIEELEERKEFAMVLPPVSVVADTIKQQAISGDCMVYCLLRGMPCDGLSFCVALGPGSGGPCSGYSLWIQ